MNALCSRRASWQQPSPTSLGVPFCFHLYIFLLRYWPLLLLLLLLLLLAAAAVPLPLLLLLAPPLPELHITTGFPRMLNIDQRQVQLLEHSICVGS